MWVATLQNACTDAEISGISHFSLKQFENESALLFASCNLLTETLVVILTVILPSRAA